MTPPYSTNKIRPHHQPTRHQRQKRKPKSLTHDQQSNTPTQVSKTQPELTEVHQDVNRANRAKLAL